jgi:hypothetical protein
MLQEAFKEEVLSTTQVRGSSCNVTDFCPILSKIGKLWQILIKSPNIELHENSERGSYAVPCGQTDGHDEDSSHLSQLFENEKKLSDFYRPENRTKEEVT